MPQANRYEDEKKFACMSHQSFTNTSHHCTYTAAATNDASLAEICIMYSPSIRQVPSLGMVDSAVAIAQ